MNDQDWETVARVAARAATAPAAALFRLRETSWTVQQTFGLPEGAVGSTARFERHATAKVTHGPTLPFGKRSMVVVPVRDELLLVVLDDRERGFDADVLDGLEGVAKMASEWLADCEAHELAQRHLERADRLAMVGKLGAGIAHELGTPLAVVSGRARQLANGQVAADQVLATARTIAEQADRMAGIIRQLLDFARRRGPRLGRFDARTLLRQSVALLEPVASRRGVTLSLDELPEPIAAQFDGSQMLQVLSNLVVNAMHATPTGGTVRLGLSEAWCSPPPETGLAARSYVQLRVVDTGAGIAPEHLSRVFEPFFTTKDTGEGTGLGLPVAQGIVRDHDGWISVESTHGQGSTFTVHLPA
jgi:signal transduction histidine kinase